MAAGRVAPRHPVPIIHLVHARRALAAPTPLALPHGQGNLGLAHHPFQSRRDAIQSGDAFCQDLDASDASHQRGSSTTSNSSSTTPAAILTLLQQRAQFHLRLAACRLRPLQLALPGSQDASQACGGVGDEHDARVQQSPQVLEPAAVPRIPQSDHGIGAQGQRSQGHGHDVDAGCYAVAGVGGGQSKFGQGRFVDALMLQQFRHHALRQDGRRIAPRRDPARLGHRQGGIHVALSRVGRGTIADVERSQDQSHVDTRRGRDCARPCPCSPCPCPCPCCPCRPYTGKHTAQHGIATNLEFGQADEDGLVGRQQFATQFGPRRLGDHAEDVGHVKVGAHVVGLAQGDVE